MTIFGQMTKNSGIFSCFFVKTTFSQFWYSLKVLTCIIQKVHKNRQMGANGLC